MLISQVFMNFILHYQFDIALTCLLLWKYAQIVIE